MRNMENFTRQEPLKPFAPEDIADLRAPLHINYQRLGCSNP